MNFNEATVREHYRELTELLIEKKLTITTMESCTSGQVASLITDTEGASAILKGAYVTYSNEAKIMQGVPAETIEVYSVYSRETAKAMAEACRASMKADIGMGVTGSMGNVDPANAAASVPGRVFFATSTEKGTDTFALELEPQPTRLQYKLVVADKIWEQLIQYAKTF